MLTIDGRDFDSACIIDGLTETFSLLEGVSSQRTQSNKVWYDIIGTEVTHTFTIRRDDTSLTAWEELWAILRNPIDYHTITVPDGYDGVMTYRAHITTATRNLEFIDANNKRHYGDYTVTFIPEKPQITI